MIMDRDTKYSAAFRAALTRERIEPVRLPPRSPKIERVCGEIRTLGEDGVYRADDLLQQIVA
jgi:hypothetical protein